MFYHSLISDWNNGNAHFLRGVVTELLSRGHDVRVYEPRGAWSLKNLREQHGEAPIQGFGAVYRELKSTRYDLSALNLDSVLRDVDLVIVHEWNDSKLIKRLGMHRSFSGSYRLLFHDTHHRSASAPQSIEAYELHHYDGVLAYGEVIRNIYLSRGWVRDAWTWHEAADVRVFYPRPAEGRDGDLVWIGNWGDDERTAELCEFLLEPAKTLELKTRAYGVRYPEPGLRALADAGIEFLGWLPNYSVPQVFARHRVTVHIPRRPYVRALPGIPTIRPFEALACGIPLVCSPWEDLESLFTPGKDFLVAHNGEEMKRHLRAIIHDRDMAQDLALHGRRTILDHHTCAHRVDELLSICESLGLNIRSNASHSDKWHKKDSRCLKA